MIFKEIAVIGGGVIGTTTAFQLANIGHHIILIDPEKNQSIDTRSNCVTGSKASLGVLMGHIFRRSSGRAWRLRQRSMQLWPELIKKINHVDIDLELKTPLIQLAGERQEIEFFKKLTTERSHLGLKLLNANINTMQKIRPWPNNQYGGLISTQDGHINPIKLLKSLLIALEKLNVSTINSKVLFLQRSSGVKIPKWKIALESNQTIQTDYVIICSALGSESILKSIGYEYSIEGVLGQAIELILEEDSKDWQNWPAVLVSNGINIIPQNKNEVLIGATLEHNTKTPSTIKIKKMLELNGNAPKWLKSASIKNHWYGLRARPKNQPAPLLENLEPGLIVNTAHYRNGVLLAPACAEWVAAQISK